jgi:hypothetical protein
MIRRLSVGALWTATIIVVLVNGWGRAAEIVSLAFYVVVVLTMFPSVLAVRTPRGAIALTVVANLVCVATMRPGSTLQVGIYVASALVISGLGFLFHRTEPFRLP